MNLLLTLIIVALAAASSFLPSTGKVFDNSNRFKGFSKIRPRGWWTLGLILLLIGTTTIQNWLNEDEAKGKELQRDKEEKVKEVSAKKRSDSTLLVMKKQSDLNNLNMVKALAEYGFKADSSNNKLVKIVRDSSKTRVIVADDPVVRICDIAPIKSSEANSDSLRYSLKICSDDAGSTGFDMSCQVVIIDTSNNAQHVGEIELLSKGSRMSKGGKVEQKFTAYKVKRFKVLYMYVEGSYKNLDRTKTFPINVIYTYKFQGDEFTGELSKYQKELVENKFFRKNK